MTQPAPHEIVALVRHFTGDNWFHLYELTQGLSPAAKDRCLQLLVDELPVAQEEKQTQIIDLMLYIDPLQSLPYLLQILQQTSSSAVKYHICWIGEGRADASWVPVLHTLVRTDPDPAVRMAGIITLAFIKDPSVIPVLQEVMDYDTGEVHGRRLSDEAQILLHEVQSPPV